MGLREEYKRAYLATRIEQRPTASTKRPLAPPPHPPPSTISFRSFNQFVSSALTSSSIHSKVITSHLPPPLAISLTSSRRAHLAEKQFHFIPPPGEFRTIVGWVACFYGVETGWKFALCHLAGSAALCSG